MPQYLSPGVYVEYVPPASLPIAGVATSIAGFIGVVADDVTMPPRPGQFYFEFPSQFQLDDNGNPVLNDEDEPELIVDPIPFVVKDKEGKPAFFEDDEGNSVPLLDADGNPTVFVKDKDEKTALVTYGSHVLVKDNEGNPVPVLYDVADAGEPILITSWEEFKTKFGDFQEGNKILAHAVYGFFFNGGTRCHVLRVATATEIDDPSDELEKFEAVDEITIVAVPGAVSDIQHNAIIAHCAKMGDRVAILDGDQTQGPGSVNGIRPVGRSQQASYAAIYYPWIKVFDPVTKAPDTIPPSGHIAGIYARNDATRGVFKAPANEVVVNALDVSRSISKAQQDGLNPEGINVIRSFKGTIKVWGARTMADDANADFRYISTRRYFNYLVESINDGTQFAVFEPNDLGLWQRIKRTVGDFLLNEWRSGALFGETPDKAFFVKCDAETNPKEVRELGQVVTLIGVAIVKPAEFVIFRIQQTAGE
ncbi:MAG: phage tail sheath family protein [Okeania sp. SIO3H1]|uniref:phage tail sheath family protein n=1 Tax=Okeania sp. SIO1I7 TaxID=2607772 RepID=UPI0013C7D492|nr:phage tail sheath subtilisin-like domain-containing protein [Okeania sp. SIO1I7]NEN88205.1 phage tail sheath family protein [Okeania sp. SIO3H1]NET24648.1 phage tail sheath family protein [Okeania sp. SIO1I7]